jgi:hypothetical protein
MAAAGIEMLPAAAGVPVVRRELQSGHEGEVVIAGALGVLLEETPQPIETPQGPVRGAEASITVNRGLEVRTQLDPKGQPFLDDHRIDGTPVLPGVMGMEAFAETAAALAPGYALTSLEDVELHAPFKFYRDEPRTLEVRALVRDDRQGGLIADCALAGRRTLASGDEQETVHFTGRVRLSREPLPAPSSEPPPELPQGAVVEHDAVYRVYFHGPAYRVLEGARLEADRAVGVMRAALPPNAKDPGAPELVAPRLVELCFQTAGVLEIARRQVFGLPSSLESLRVVRTDGGGRLFAEVRPREDGAGYDARVVDAQGNVHVELSGYRTIPIPEPANVSELTEPADGPLAPVESEPQRARA